MPIAAPNPVTQPPSPVAPQFVPIGQRVPVEPARRVTPAKDTRGSELDPDKKRRRQDDRGGTLDLEV